MATAAFYLDKRVLKKDGTYPIKLRITRGKKQMYIGTPFSSSLEDWKDGEKAKKKEFLTENILMNNMLSKIRNLLLIMECNDEFRHMTDAELLNRCIQEIGKEKRTSRTLEDVANEHVEESMASESTRNNFKNLVVAMRDYAKREVKIEDITREMVVGFERYNDGRGKKHNTVVTYMARLRTIVRFALEKKYIHEDPFIGYRPKKIERTRSRALSVEQLRAIRNAELSGNEAYSRDMFMLHFYLLGINTADLMDAKVSDVVNGRLEYRRKKTRKMYSVLIPKEAKEIIDRYPDKGGVYLIDMHNRFATTLIAQHGMHMNLRRIKHKGKVVQGDITTYWSRHSVATLMINELRTPIEVVSAALGHEYGSRITNMYVNLDQRLVDEAQARLIWLVCKK